MRAVDDLHAGIASGINNATARIAGMLAIAVLGMIAITAFGAALDARLGQMTLSNEMRELVRAEIPKFAEAGVPPSIEGAQRGALQQALNESFVHSFRIVALIAAALALASSLCGWLMIGVERPRSPLRPSRL
jgi:hypothetical protein